MIFARRIKNFGDFSDICHNSPMLFQARSRGGSSPGLGVVLGQVAMLFWPRSRSCSGPTTEKFYHKPHEHHELVVRKLLVLLDAKAEPSGFEG